MVKFDMNFIAIISEDPIDDFSSSSFFPFFFFFGLFFICVHVSIDAQTDASRDIFTNNNYGTIRDRTPRGNDITIYDESRIGENRSRNAARWKSSLEGIIIKRNDRRGSIFD